MSEKESEFMKELKLTLLRGIIGLLGTSILAAVVFYFSMSYRVATLEQEMPQKADKILIETELKYNKEANQRIENTLNKIETKLDKHISK